MALAYNFPNHCRKKRMLSIGPIGYRKNLIDFDNGSHIFMNVQAKYTIKFMQFNCKHSRT